MTSVRSYPDWNRPSATPVTVRRGGPTCGRAATPTYGSRPLTGLAARELRARRRGEGHVHARWRAPAAAARTPPWISRRHSVAQHDLTKGDQTDAEAGLLDIVFGHWRSQILRSLATLSVADHLAGGPLTAAEVAAREGSVTDRTFRLMRAGVEIWLLTADADGRFGSTPLLDTMRKESPRSLHPVAMGLTSPWLTLSWRLLPEAVRPNVEPATAALGTDLFNYLEGNPEEEREFSDLMAALTTLWAGNVADLIDTTDVNRAIDVGGSSGSLLRQLQERNPRLRGVIFDRPNVSRKIAPSVAAGDFASHTEVVGGDFFVSVPAGDLYLLKMIL